MTDTNVYITECPKCKTRVTRSEGCSHMTCPECNTAFCIYCGADITDHISEHKQQCTIMKEDPKFSITNNNDDNSSNEPEMNLFVQDLKGKNYTLQIDKNCSVDSFKQQAIQKMGLSNATDIRFIGGHKQLENGNTLADYGIQKNSTIFVAYRLRGGI